MNSKFYTVLLIVLALAAASSAYAIPSVKLTTSPIPAADINQGTNTVLVYIVKMKVTSAPVTINNVQFTLSGTHDANDLTYTNVYFNTVPTVSGAVSLGYSGAGFAAPHTYTIGVNKPMAAGDSGYFMITVNVAATASDGNTIRITGATTPVVFGYSVAVNLTNSQTNGNAQTVQAADVKLSSSAVAASTVNQGTNTVLVYAIKMKVATEPVVVNSVQYTLSGSHDNDDLTYTNVYFNTMPSLSGAVSLGYSGAGFAAPHTYTIGVNKPLAKGDSGYFLITVNFSAKASDGKTVRITGATTPMVFGFTTAPNVTGSQANGNVHTVQAADIKLSSSAVAASTVNQGTNTVLIYAIKMKVTTEPVVVNSIQYTLSGSHDNNDLTYTNVYFNTTPSLSGATSLGYSGAGFAAPHTYTIGINKPIAAGDSGYFMITVNVAANADDGRTVKITAATTPISFGFTTGPNVTGTQNNGNTLTVQAADIKLSTSAVAASTVKQGTNTVLVYALKMKVTTEPVVVNSIQYTLSGTHDNNDLTYTNVYFNKTPTLTGATSLGYSGAGFAAPHTYTIGINKPLAAGDSGYFMMTVNVAAGATDGKTIRITGSTTPTVFTFTTAPNVTGTQSNGNTHTIEAADITLSSNAVSAGNIARGSNTNIVYIAKMVVATEPVVVNSVQYTLTGTHDNDDLSYTNVYFNTSANLTGATSLGYSGAGFAAPHTYTIGVNKPMAIGDVGYFIITVNVSATATVGNTVNINGNTNPLAFGFTTAPNVTNNQTNAAGIKTISSGTPFGLNGSKTDEPSSITSCRIYPNPATEIVNIEASFNAKQEVLLQITNESGAIVRSKIYGVTTGINTLRENAGNLLSGLYQVTILSKEHDLLFSGKIRIAH